jgi:hypothetical protein
MLPSGFQQTFFAKFLSLTIQSFRNTIGVKQDSVAWSLAFFDRAIPSRTSPPRCRLPRGIREP